MMMPSGPGSRGSIPALVMRTGLIQPVDPANARNDISAQHVHNVTHWPVDEGAAPSMPMPGSMPQVTPLMPAPPSPTVTAVAQTVVATPPMPIATSPDSPPPFRPSDRHRWHHEHRHENPMIADMRRLHPTAMMHGTAEVLLGEWNGKPVAKFEIAASPPAGSAQSAANALRGGARALMTSGLHALPAELVGGPLAALMRGGAVELHFQNGVVVRTAL